jgi:hypothetical protein
LQQYEISPTEPLHDLKGHLSDIIDEALHISTGDCLEAIKSVKKSCANKGSSPMFGSTEGSDSYIFET